MVYLMTKSKLFIMFLLSSLIILSFSNIVLCINPSDAFAIVSWESSTLYQGDFVPARITFTSNFSRPIEIYYVGIHFDWMSSDNFQGRDLSLTPITVQPFGTHSFDIMMFSIPTTAFIGEHEYFVGIDGSYSEVDGGVEIGFAWDSRIFKLNIFDSTQKSYSELDSQVSNKLNQTRQLVYDSPQANSLISQAETAYAAAKNHSSNNQFSEAIASLNVASSYIDQANTEEQIYDQQQQEQSQIILIISIGIAAIIIIVIIFIFVSKKQKPKKINESTPTSESSELKKEMTS